MKVYVKNRKRRKEEFQFFMHDFVDCCIENGIESVRDILPFYKFHIRAILRFVLLLLYKLKKMVGIGKNNKGAVIVTTTGDTIIDNSFPYFYNKEIIPVVWDNWPPSFDKFLSDIKLLNCKTIFVTVKDHSEYLNEHHIVKAYWLPEGINGNSYHAGVDLKDRPYDVFEMGRQMPKYHEILNELNEQGLISGYLNSNSQNKQGSWIPLDQLISCIPNYKIMICFPRCDTNPKAKGVETLTQRYWEAMLCRCLIVGRAPQELIDLCGYNPVIDVDWSMPTEQIIDILSNIDIHQDIVNRNYEYATKNADWKYRMPYLIEKLEQNNYKL